MPNSALGLTYANYKSDATLTANMQIWLKERAVDQVFNGVPLFRYLTGRDQKEMTLDQIKASGALDLRDGGQSIDIPLLTESNSTVASYHNYQTISTTPQQGIGPASINWREYAATVTISRLEELTNMDTKSRVIRLLQTKQLQTEKSLIDRFNQDLWLGDQNVGGSFDKNFSTDVEGVPYWIEENPIVSTDVGRINRADESFWRNQFNGPSQVVTTTTPSFAAEGKNDIQLYVMESSGGPGFDEVDCLFTTKTVYNYLWDSLEDMRRYTSSDTGDAGYRRLSFQSIPVYWDAQLTRDNVYGLNSNYMSMVVHRDAFLSSEGFQRPTNQTAKTAIIMMMWNLVVSNPRRFFCLSGITA